jgi:hypothetical protein
MNLELHAQAQQLVRATVGLITGQNKAPVALSKKKLLSSHNGIFCVVYFGLFATF